MTSAFAKSWNIDFSLKTNILYHFFVSLVTFFIYFLILNVLFLWLRKIVS